jgi:rubrerythrin
MTKTQDNLQAAFAGESQASRKYLAFAKRAEEEGCPQAARLFRAAAEAETIHAANHLRALGEIKSTAENLKTAIAGEYYEHTSMYPEFIAEAEAAGEKKALTTLRWAMEVEKVHEQLYRQALDCLAAGAPQDAVEIYVCPICGYTHLGPAPERCPVCATPGTRFELID